MCFDDIKQCNEIRLELFLGAHVARVLQLQNPLPMKGHFTLVFIPHWHKFYHFSWELWSSQKANNSAIKCHWSELCIDLVFSVVEGRAALCVRDQLQTWRNEGYIARENWYRLFFNCGTYNYIQKCPAGVEQWADLPDKKDLIPDYP